MVDIHQFNLLNLGLTPYLNSYQAMIDFTNQRNHNTLDEIWLVEHPNVYTQGRVGQAEHILKKCDIPIIQTKRGGQITYHAPGQQIMYVLIDLKRKKMGIRDIVTYLENCVIDTLKYYHIKGYTKADAPGVYVDHKKICSLGLEIHRSCTLHGLALNIDMDLTPFSYINPCGHAGLEMTQLSDYVASFDRKQINKLLMDNFIKQFSK